MVKQSLEARVAELEKKLVALEAQIKEYWTLGQMRTNK